MTLTFITYVNEQKAMQNIFLLVISYMLHNIWRLLRKVIDLTMSSHNNLGYKSKWNENSRDKRPNIHDIFLLI